MPSSPAAIASCPPGARVGRPRQGLTRFSGKGRHLPANGGRGSVSDGADRGRSCTSVKIRRDSGTVEGRGPLPGFSQVLILKKVKVLCFHTLLEVFILKVLTVRHDLYESNLDRDDGVSTGSKGNGCRNVHRGSGQAGVMSPGAILPADYGTRILTDLSRKKHSGLSASKTLRFVENR
jgi:hypothetical protein